MHNISNLGYDLIKWIMVFMLLDLVFGFIMRKQNSLTISTTADSLEIFSEEELYSLQV